MHNGKLNTLLSDLDKEQITSYATNINVIDRYELSDANIPDQSIAVLSLQGMLLPWKTFELEKTLKMAEANNRIVGIVLLINSPGGTVHRIDTCTNLIKNLNKPVIGIVSGVCASAAMWIASGCKKILACSELDVFGSIGIKTSFFNDSKYWSDLGIEMRDIYASASTEKDAEYKAAQKGNDEPIINRLNNTFSIFQKAVSENLNIRIADTPVWKGATFTTADAISVGLCHGISTLEDAVKTAYAMGIVQQANKLR